jgi:ferric iron reductase protein FhuF
MLSHRTGRLGAVLASRLSALGPYFEVAVGATGDGWLPLSALPAVAEERVAFVRGELSRRAGVEVSTRVAASIHQLGFASRLVAPALGAVALASVVPSFDDLRWRPVDGGPVPIAVSKMSETAAGVEAFDELVLRQLVAPVVSTFASLGVSPIVLWGNVASALAGAAGMLVRSGERLTVDPVTFLEALFSGPGPLHGAGRFDVDGRFFVRASCCLFYRIPNAGKCGDCVLL